MGSTLKVDNIVGTSGTSAPITLSGDTATLGSGVAMAANHSGVKTAINASGTAPIYAARAWVNFNGGKNTAGAASNGNTNRLINGSANVTSVLRNAAGDYTITFTTAIPNNFAMTGSVYSGNTNGNRGISGVMFATADTTDSGTSCRVFTMYGSDASTDGAKEDPTLCTLIFFG